MRGVVAAENNVRTELLRTSVLLSGTCCRFYSSRCAGRLNLHSSPYMLQATESLHWCNRGLSALLHGTSAVDVEGEKSTSHAVPHADFYSAFWSVKDGNFLVGCLIFFFFFNRLGSCPLPPMLLWRRMTPVLTSSSSGYSGYIEGHFVEFDLACWVACST